MKADYESVTTQVESATRRVTVRFLLRNQSAESWEGEGGPVFGWQLFDPGSGRFVTEGEWSTLGKVLHRGEQASMEVPVTLPEAPGPYHVYLSLLKPGEGWAYHRGWPLLVLAVEVADGLLSLQSVNLTTLKQLRRRKFGKSLRQAFVMPFKTIWTNRALIRSMVRRDILTRYRGSFGDMFWTILNPLLLMATYFFVFAVVMESRLPNDKSRTGFALYFLAGMLPWLAFSEAVARAPQIVWEYRNLVKKLVFPLETLPVTQVSAGLMTQIVGTGIYLIGLAVLRGAVPVTAAWIPVIIVPQLLFTVGLCWFLAGLGAYLRDLGQLIGFFLTLWFFLTPICYPEQNLPKVVLGVLGKNPIYILVRQYRIVMIDGHVPEWLPMVKLWVLSIVVFLFGHAWFYKLKRTFADVI